MAEITGLQSNLASLAKPDLFYKKYTVFQNILRPP